MGGIVQGILTAHSSLSFDSEMPGCCPHISHSCLFSREECRAEKVNHRGRKHVERRIARKKKDLEELLSENNRGRMLFSRLRYPLLLSCYHSPTLQGHKSVVKCHVTNPLCVVVEKSRLKKSLL